MKTIIYSIRGEKKGELALPIQFEEPFRKDLIKKAVIIMRSRGYQPHGTDPLAGTRQGDACPKRRRKYRGTYGHGISRIRRKALWHRGMQFGWVGAFVASAVGGRMAFPPMAEKVLASKLNKKERRKAVCSAISAASSKVVEDEFEDLKKSRDVHAALIALGLKEELARSSGKKVRAGRGKMRGRRYKTKKGPLLVVSKACNAVKAARNLPGVDIINVRSLNAELLAPGCQPGRIAVWTEGAIRLLDKESLFK